MQRILDCHILLRAHTTTQPAVLHITVGFHIVHHQAEKKAAVATATKTVGASCIADDGRGVEHE